MAEKEYEYLVEIPESELIQLVIQVKMGNKIAIGKVITVHIPVITRVCGRYINIHRQKKDDIISSGMLGLTQAVVWSSQGRLYDLNITPYIVETAKRFIKEFLETDHLINIPRKTFHKIIVEKPEFIPVVITAVTISGEDEENHIEDYSYNIDRSIQPEIPTDEILDALHLSDFERKVVKLKADGYTFQEIADRLEKSNVGIFKTLESIKERVKV